MEFLNKLDPNKRYSVSDIWKLIGEDLRGVFGTWIYPDKLYGFIRNGYKGVNLKYFRSGNPKRGKLMVKGQHFVEFMHELDRKLDQVAEENAE